MKYPNRIIKKGENDSQIVISLQKRLNICGCGPLKEDGDFGNNTESAVKLFQSTRTDHYGNPLVIDGKVGALTWSTLFNLESVPSVSSTTNEFRRKLVEVAIQEVGTLENPLGSNSGPKVNQYLASVGLGPGYYWCAAFVYYCGKLASERLDLNNPIYKTAGCLEHWNNTKGVKITKARAVNDSSLIKIGSIFIMDHGGGAGHTGIVTSVEGGYINTIEGNSNTKGNRNGIGVFQLKRKVNTIQKGFIIYN